MAENVRFYFGAQAKYDALAEKNSLALYFIEDTQRLYKGDVLIATGANATSLAAGLMSAEDKARLDSLVNSTISGLVPVDGTIVVSDGEGGVKQIGVRLSAQEGNILSAKEDGLFAAEASYTMEKQAEADDGYAVTYKLKKTENGVSTYVGDAVNIPKDKVLQSAVLKTVTEENVPYEGAHVGDQYIDMAFNDETSSHIYVPLGDIGGNVEAEIVIDAANANGLSYVDGSGLSLALASAESNGAMSKEMFAAVDGLLSLDLATKDYVKSTVGVPNAEQFVIDDNGVLNIDSIDAEQVVYQGKKLSELLDNASTAYTWEELPEIVNATPAEAASKIADAPAGAVVKMSEGTVSTAVAVNKSVTVEGVNAGIAQDFAQEV